MKYLQSLVSQCLSGEHDENLKNLAVGVMSFWYCSGLGYDSLKTVVWCAQPICILQKMCFFFEDKAKLTFLFVQVTCLKYSSCGTYIFSSSLHSAGVNVWFAATGTLIGLLGNKYVVDSMERLRGRGCLVAAGRHVGNRCDATIAVWKESMGKNLGSFVFDGEVCLTCFELMGVSY